MVELLVEFVRLCCIVVVVVGSIVLCVRIVGSMCIVVCRRGCVSSLFRRKLSESSVASVPV